jgi:hypothetical protein
VKLQLSLFALVAGLAAPALAAPPPLPVAVSFLDSAGAPDSSEQTEALRRALVADNWFADAPAQALKDEEFLLCRGVQAVETCARAAIAGHMERRPVEVLVLLHPGTEGRRRIVCVGPVPPEVEPTAEIDLANPSAEDRIAAARCIIAAAAQSGW